MIFKLSDTSKLLQKLAVFFVTFAILAGCSASSTLKSSPYLPPTQRYTAIVVDVRSGKVLHNTKADAIRFPASLTKMMTMYMMFESLAARKVSLNTPIPISARAAARPASKLYLRAGSTITVDQAMHALAIKSANDVAYAVAEFLAGSEKAFADRMTFKARSLGMRSTTFRNASGLPDKRQVSTARDMAKLGVALRKRFPQYYHYFGKSSFKFRGKTIRGHNRVLGTVRGADGIKTGYTRASGFNLVTSVQYGGRSLVGVIMGENSGKSRNKHMTELMNFHLKRRAR